MFEILQTRIFEQWLSDLPDRRAKTRIARRLDRVKAGLLGDVKSLGEGISEIRIDEGPGYRLYFTIRGRIIVILLCGGEKRTQARDILAARALAHDLEIP